MGGQGRLEQAAPYSWVDPPKRHEAQKEMRVRVGSGKPHVGLGTAGGASGNEGTESLRDMIQGL